MDSDHLNGQADSLLLFEYPLQRGPEQGPRAEAFDPPKARLNAPERRGQPALLLVGRAPVIDFGHAVRDQAVERLQTVRVLQADPELGKHAEAMQGERRLQSLVQEQAARGKPKVKQAPYTITTGPQR